MIPTTGTTGDNSSIAGLAVEMAAGVGSVAGLNGSRSSSRQYPDPRRQSRSVYTGVREVLGELELELAALDFIAYGCGPGAFTGLRVAAAVAQALSYGAGLPVVPVSSLAALAAGAARTHGVNCMAPCLDARMGEAYLAVYTGDQGDELRATLPDCLVDPAHFTLPPDLRIFAAGPGWSACPELTDRHATQIVGSDTSLVPSAVDVLALAVRQFHAGRTVAADQAVPNYIRDQVTH